MQKRELLDYLREVKALEDDVYTMDEAIMHLEKSKKPMPQRTAILAPSRGAVDCTEVKMAGLWIGMILGFIIPIPVVGWWAILLSPICMFLGGIILAYVFEGIGKAGNEAEAQRKYIEDMKQYRQRIQEDEVRFMREEEAVTAYNNAVKEKIKEIMSVRAQTMAALEKLYSVGIVYIKYRSIIPVTMFCEYLESGRCESLEGPDGMYNLYESELRLNLIIGELQKVRNVLGRISAQIGSVSAELSKMRDNQYLLCRSLEEGNRIAQRICTSALAAERNSAAALRNSEWAAYNSEITARNTKAIARVAEFEHMQKYVLAP